MQKAYHRRTRKYNIAFVKRNNHMSFIYITNSKNKESISHLRMLKKLYKTFPITYVADM